LTKARASRPLGVGSLKNTGWRGQGLVIHQGNIPHFWLGYKALATPPGLGGLNSGREFVELGGVEGKEPTTKGRNKIK